MADLTPADVFAMNGGRDSGFLEGNGIIILILFFLMLGGGWGNFGGNASQGMFTRAEMYEGFNNQNTVNSLNNLGTAINAGFNGVQLGMSNGFNGVQSSIANMGFNMQQCCCSLKEQISAQTNTILQALNDQTIQSLRDKLEDKDRELNSAIFAASQLTQTRTLEDFILANKS